MLREVRKIAAGALAVCCAVVLGLAGLTAVTGAGAPVAVLMPGSPDAALAAIAAAGGSVLEVRGAQVIAISDSPDFVPRLYRAGALLVVLAGEGGCGFGAATAKPDAATAI